MINQNVCLKDVPYDLSICLSLCHQFLSHDFTDVSSCMGYIWIYDICGDFVSIVLMIFPNMSSNGSPCVAHGFPKYVPNVSHFFPCFKIQLFRTSFPLCTLFPVFSTYVPTCFPLKFFPMFLHTHDIWNSLFFQHTQLEGVTTFWRST